VKLAPRWQPAMRCDQACGADSHVAARIAELVQDILPPGVLNVVNGFGLEAGKPLASSPRIAKIAFTGETTTGRLIMQYASENIIPSPWSSAESPRNLFRRRDARGG